MQTVRNPLVNFQNDGIILYDCILFIVTQTKEVQDAKTIF